MNEPEMRKQMTMEPDIQPEETPDTTKDADVDFTATWRMELQEAVQRRQ